MSFQRSVATICDVIDGCYTVQRKLLWRPVKFQVTQIRLYSCSARSDNEYPSSSCVSAIVCIRNTVRSEKSKKLNFSFQVSKITKFVQAPSGAGAGVTLLLLPSCAARSPSIHGPLLNEAHRIVPGIRIDFPKGKN